jgi:hypothetical protein
VHPEAEALSGRCTIGSGSSLAASRLHSEGSVEKVLNWRDADDLQVIAAQGFFSQPLDAPDLTDAGKLFKALHRMPVTRNAQRVTRNS